MAQSPAHRFGQIIGEVLEAAVLPLLKQFARDHQLYLDKHGSRPARRGKKCSWLDANGNTHDLDFVLERGGTPRKVGMPAAFIETAWRRYTKHSRNKVQEIQGAIEPLAQTFKNSGPFKGAVLAGVFTDGALKQLRSLGFTVLYFPYESVLEVFKRAGIDASFDESTADDSFQEKVDAYERLIASQRKQLVTDLVKAHQDSVDQFVKSLSIAVSRQVERVIILALHGTAHEAATIDDAIHFIEGYDDDGQAGPIERYEIDVRYNNRDSIQGSFRDKAAAIAFLKTYLSVSPRLA